MHDMPYTCHRAVESFAVDGDLNKSVWAQAERTPRFGEMGNGRVTLFDTRAAMLWDDVEMQDWAKACEEERGSL